MECNGKTFVYFAHESAELHLMYAQCVLQMRFDWSETQIVLDLFMLGSANK